MPFCTVCGTEADKLNGKCSACEPKFAFCVECGIEKEKEKFNNSKRCANCLLVMKNIRNHGSKSKRRKPLNKRREFILGSLIGFLISFLGLIMPAAFLDSDFSGILYFSLLAIIISVIYYSANRRFEFAGGILFGSILLPILIIILLNIIAV
jgi:hypothetical protein